MGWAFPDSWGDWTDKVKTELTIVVETISRFEPVRLLTKRGELRDATARFAGGNVEIVEAPIEDFWMRDIAPTFACGENGVVAIDWNFDNWGRTIKGPTSSLSGFFEKEIRIPTIRAPFTAEGGAFITDGEGTLITTRSCLLNPNRNPVRMDYDRQSEIERALRAFGIERVIWLEGDPCEDISSGHVDGYAMFAAAGGVLVETIGDDSAEYPMWQSRDLETLDGASDAKRRIKITTIFAPRKKYWKFRNASWAPCYLNAYIANGAIIAANFGDRERDEAANAMFKKMFPGRKVVMLRIDHIANGGGGIHCMTQPVPPTDELNSV